MAAVLAQPEATPSTSAAALIFRTFLIISKNPIFSYEDGTEVPVLLKVVTQSWGNNARNAVVR
ncbi:MAG: hypothetical protein AAGA84_08895 [Pseudomonadota bacterium]